MEKLKPSFDENFITDEIVDDTFDEAELTAESEAPSDSAVIDKSENKLEFTAERKEVGLRIDAYLSDATGMTRSALQKLIADGNISVNGKSVTKSYKMREDDMTVVTLPLPVPCEALPEDIPLDVVYEDKYLLVVNKPKGMVVHPAPGNPNGTLVNALLFHCKTSLSSINGVIRPGIVHRIDKDTSGLLIVAKCNEAHLGLAEQIKTHSFDRVYNAIVVGNLKDDCGTIDKFLGRNPRDRKKMAVVKPESPGARRAVTHYKVLERFGASCAYTYVELTLETGRTHQIRVHMASLGHPVLGDPLYRGRFDRFEKTNAELLSGQCLHARKIGFIHPITGEKLFFDSGLPAYFLQILEKIRKV